MNRNVKIAAMVIVLGAVFFAVNRNRSSRVEPKPAVQEHKLPEVKTDPVKKQAVLQAGAEKRKAADAARVVFEKLEAREAEIRKALKAGEDFTKACEADEQWKTLSAEFKQKEAILIAAQNELMKKAREAISKKDPK